MANIKRLSSFVYGIVFIVLSSCIFISNSDTDHSNSTNTIISSLSATSQSDNIESENNLVNNNEISSEKHGKSEFLTAISISKNGDTESAITAYRQVLSTNKNHQSAAVNLAIIMKREHGCDAAMHDIKYAASISRGKRLSSALSMQAGCLMKRGMPEDAIPLLKRSIEFRPNHASTWERLALALEKTGHEGKTVLATYKKSLALNSKNIRLRMAVAKYQQKALDFHGSNATLKARYKSIKKVYRAQYLLAWNYLELAKFNNAKKHIRIAKSLDKSQHDLMNAMILYCNKENKKSIDLIKGINKKSAIYHYLLGLNYKSRNWPISANKQFSKSNKLASLNMRIQYHLALMNINYKNNDGINANIENIVSKQAIIDQPLYLHSVRLFEYGHHEIANTWLEKIPHPNQNKKISNFYAKNLWVLGEKNQAINILIKSLESDSKRHKSEETIRLLAQYYLATSEIDAAEIYLNMIPKSDHTKNDFKLLSKINAKNNHFQHSITTLESAVEMWSNDISLRLLLSDSYKKNSQTDKSIQQLNLILKLDKNNSEAKSLLSQYKQEGISIE